MGTTYHVNEFDEVVPCLDGRVSNSTSDRRYTTDFEKQLLEEIKDLQTEIEQLKANPVEAIVIPKIAGTSYKPETPFRVCEDGTFNLIYNLRENKGRRTTQPEFINDITISLSNNHHLTKEQIKEIAETICYALNSNFSA